MRLNLPLRIRDFLLDLDRWIYAVAAYDNEERAGCLLRYVPDPAGDRVDPDGRRYRKVGFEEGYELLRDNKPEFLDLLHRVPYDQISGILKPELECKRVEREEPRMKAIADQLALVPGMYGCSGSRLCGLANAQSDIDLVVYGPAWFTAQQHLQQAIAEGRIQDLDEELWQRVYAKRNPSISYPVFRVHEERKWNRGRIGGTYFDLLYARSYDDLAAALPSGKGAVLGKETVEGVVTDDRLAFDAPAIYPLEGATVDKVLSFTHTYTGQVRAGETLRAKGVVEQHGDERWLVVGTTREAKGEYIISLSLLEA
jgi:predicted nucleotidyltransferase